MVEPSFKQTKLSLERPYKDDNGDRIPVLFDISPEGQQIYEKKESSTKILGDNLRRIFIERGVDFFEKNKDQRMFKRDAAENADVEHSEDAEQDSPTTRHMNVEELMKMRSEILHPTAVVNNLSATVVTKPSPIVSVQAFNAQLTIGSKDEALRKAGNLFKNAADSMERGRIKGEKYWVDALKVRRANWGLNPAPLPLGSATGKGADKTSKDFLISYGLEECQLILEAPPLFRRQAVARMATDNDTEHGLVFWHRRHTRLRVSVSVANVEGTTITSFNTPVQIDAKIPEGALKEAQQEVVEHEIFSLLVQEAGNLPTASARVSERLIVIDAAQGTELKIELVDDQSLSMESSSNSCGEKCNLIYFALHALLLRRHAFLQAQRLDPATFNHTSRNHPHVPPLLRPIIDLLQYQVFCDRVKAEIDKMVTALSAVGIPSSLRFDSVGETGRQLVDYLLKNGDMAIGGEAVLRIDERNPDHLIYPPIMSVAS
ncbi:hypothetical protein H0H92_008142 [Tricholoma furcatifolium]|nr:hypothetical protein H0H92_008142 [Tricholoma furcatifolium]